MPFTAEQFFSVFADYNHAVWPMQVVLTAVAIACVVLLFRSSAWASRVIATTLMLLWAWMAIAYHFAFFATINPVAWFFGAAFLGASVLFGWYGVVKAELHFELGSLASKYGLVIMVFALIGYPAIGYAVGHRYPSAPTFGLPCPTTIFTLGMLLCLRRPFPQLLSIIPLLWSAIGSIAAFQLGVVEDLSLLAAGLTTLALYVSHKQVR